MSSSWPPYSQEFQDRYFAEEDGYEETKYVFLNQNSLESRFKEASNFVIGELGFGTGLNFLSTWNLWKGISSSGHLHYFSCEKFPLSKEEIGKICSHWPELDPFREAFLEKYETLKPGPHRFHFDSDRLTLTLLIGDALESLQGLQARVDCWFLDGFAPRKNPEMWSQELFDHVFRLSKPGTTFTTYSVAGWIRRNLKSAGFTIEKFAGFGRKREMLKGLKPISTASTIKPQKNPMTIAVVGAGLSGTHLALSLARRGARVQLIDRREKIAAEASGNPAALTLPSFSAEDNVLSTLTWKSFDYLIREFRPPKEMHCGLLYLIHDELQLQKFERCLDRLKRPLEELRILTAREASAQAGIPLRHQALYWTGAFYRDPVWFCENQLDIFRNRIERLLNRELKYLDFKNQRWILRDLNQTIISEADKVILAHSHEIKQVAESHWLPLRKVRGQLALIRTNAFLQPLKTFLCFDHYLSPKLGGGYHVIGSTYDNKDLSAEVREKDNKELLSHLKSVLADFHDPVDIESSRVAFRSSVPGQTPIVGALTTAQGDAIPGLYVLGALSSRGLLYAPLLAETLASHIFEEPLPLEANLYSKLSPNRFSTG